MSILPCYRDPGDNFVTDSHRRVLASLSVPSDPKVTSISQPTGFIPALARRVETDPSMPTHSDVEIAEILTQLAADGDAEEATGPDGTQGWRMTEQGLSKLTGGNANEPPPPQAGDPPPQPVPVGPGAEQPTIATPPQAAPTPA